MGRPIKKSMRVLISHKSALILMRQESFRRFAVAFGKNPHFAPREFPKLFDVAATHEVLQNLFKTQKNFPLDVLVSNPLCRHRSKKVSAYVFSKPLPENAVIHITGELYCVSPSFLPVVMSRTLSILELVFLISEICGLYTFKGDEEPVLYPHQFPLTSIASIQSTLKQLESGNAKTRVLKALSMCCGLAGSPMETKLYIRATLPFSKGGYNLGKIKVNKSVMVQRMTSRMRERSIRKPDLLFCFKDAPTQTEKRKWGIALEYNGRYHADQKQHRLDDMRRNELQALGIIEYVIWKEDYDDIVIMDNLFETIRNELNIPVHKPSQEKEKLERQKRLKLWSNLEQASRSYYQKLCSI